jgi:hypothetical protein
MEIAQQAVDPVEEQREHRRPAVRVGQRRPLRPAASSKPWLISFTFSAS